MDAEFLKLSDEISPDFFREVLLRRAALLAQAPSDCMIGGQLELLVVRLNGELFGLEAHHIREIRLVDNITRIPHTPQWVVGLTNLRGHILSAIHLGGFLGLSASATVTSPTAENGSSTERTKVSSKYLVIVQASDMEIALLADDVLTVETFPASLLRETSDLARGIDPRFVQGVIQRSKDAMFLIVLNLETILADPKLIIDQKSFAQIMNLASAERNLG